MHMKQIIKCQKRRKGKTLHQRRQGRGLLGLSTLRLTSPKGKGVGEVEKRNGGKKVRGRWCKGCKMVEFVGYL